MIVIGRKHKFTEREQQELHKKFNRIDIVKYTERNPKDVLREISKLLKQYQYHYLVLNTNATVDKRIVRYLTLLQFRSHKIGLKIIKVEDFMEKELKKCYIPTDLSNINFLAEIRPYSPYQYFLKRIVDYVGICALCTTNFMVKFYIQKKINEESPGALYYTQNRVGLNTKKFKCYKYRTMHENSYFSPYTQSQDNRVFPYGNFMRKTRIDEIPQYINVLNGEMHLVGPRAEWDILVRKYEQHIPYYNERHLVSPGITGWAQVNYPYGENEEDAKQKLMYDLYYIKHWSVLLEFKIIFKTIAVVFGKKGM